MKSISKEIAEMLLQIKAIKLEPANPFTWASGWKSPIYCDNRTILSYPAARKTIYTAFADLIEEQYPGAEVIAGVATGAIAHGALVAEKMGKPFIYIRSSAKAHGLANLIEGHYEAGNKVVVIEDLVSTGGSSLKAVEALKEAKCEVLGMAAIFTYGFDVAARAFALDKVKLSTLSDYKALIELAAETGYINQEQIKKLQEWRESPSTWGL
jgi:orotate phosphoribosyltransferase